MYTNCSFGTWIPGRYTEVAFIQGWPYKRGSTVLPLIIHYQQVGPLQPIGQYNYSVKFQASREIRYNSLDLQHSPLYIPLLLTSPVAKPCPQTSLC